MSKAQWATILAVFGNGWCVETLYTTGDACVADVARPSTMGGRELMTVYATADDACECTLSSEGVPYGLDGVPCGAFIW